MVCFAFYKRRVRTILKPLVWLPCLVVVIWMVVGSNWWSNGFDLKVAESLIKRTANCQDYFNGFPSLHTSKSLLAHEKMVLGGPNHPLAITILVGRDLTSFEVLFSLMFRPWDYHCIHLDKDSPQRYRKAVEGLIGCYQNQLQDNQLLLSAAESAAASGDQQLTAQVACMTHLMSKTAKRWQHLLMMEGRMFPHQTYLEVHDEIRRKLKNDQSSSIVSVEVPKETVEEIITKSQRRSCFSHCSSLNEDQMYPVFRLKDPQLGNFYIRLFTSNGINPFFVMSRNHVEWFTQGPVTKTGQKWFQGMDNAQNYFYPTLTRMSLDKQTSLVQQDWIHDQRKYNKTLAIQFNRFDQKKQLVNHFIDILIDSFSMVLRKKGGESSAEFKSLLKKAMILYNN